MMYTKKNVVCCRLTDPDMERFTWLCLQHGVAAQDMLHAIIVDALTDEEINVRRRKQEGR